MPDKLDAATVRHVAHLARLNISDEEVNLYARQLSAVLKHMEQLNSVNTDNVPPTAHPHDGVSVVRDDVERPSLTADEALANALQREDEFFRVPKVLDQETA